MRDRIAIIALFVFILLVAIYCEKQTSNDNEYLIYCFGDSHVSGAGSLPGLGYPEILQKIFKRHCPGFKVKIVNFGVPGLNSSCTLRMMEEKISKTKPDLVMVLTGHAPATLDNSNIREALVEKRGLKPTEISERIWSDDERQALVEYDTERMIDLARSQGFKIIFLTYPFDISVLNETLFKLKVFQVINSDFFEQYLKKIPDVVLCPGGHPNVIGYSLMAYNVFVNLARDNGLFFDNNYFKYIKLPYLTEDLKDNIHKILDFIFDFDSSIEILKQFSDDKNRYSLLHVLDDHRDRSLVFRNGRLFMVNYVDLNYNIIFEHDPKPFSENLPVNFVDYLLGKPNVKISYDNNDKNISLFDERWVYVDGMNIFTILFKDNYSLVAMVHNRSRFTDEHLIFLNMKPNLDELLEVFIEPKKVDKNTVYFYLTTDTLKINIKNNKVASWKMIPTNKLVKYDESFMSDLNNYFISGLHNEIISAFGEADYSFNIWIESEYQIRYFDNVCILLNGNKVEKVLYYLNKFNFEEILPNDKPIINRKKLIKNYINNNNPLLWNFDNFHFNKEPFIIKYNLFCSYGYSNLDFLDLISILTQLPYEFQNMLYENYAIFKIKRNDDIYDYFEYRYNNSFISFSIIQGRLIINYVDIDGKIFEKESNCKIYNIFYNKYLKQKPFEVIKFIFGEKYLTKQQSNKKSQITYFINLHHLPDDFIKPEITVKNNKIIAVNLNCQ